MDVRRTIACLLLFACLAPHAQADKRFRIPKNPYRKQWAIVIGINYEGREDVAVEGVSALKNAENDANALAETLKQYYGYTEDSVRLLLGRDATKAEILKLFGDGFLCDHDTVTTDDSVLVFFAGHGDRQSRNDRTRAVIWPYDVQAIEGKGVDSSSCVRISNILADLELSDARHKLLVLDSCHSGEVFRSGGLARSSGRFKYDPELFENKVVQAMAASRGFQKAQDGEGHSPFTIAMLESLTGGIETNSFGASALFSRVPERVKEFSKQDPRGGTISGDGEFYFFRTSAPEKIDVAKFGMVPVKEAVVTAIRSEGPISVPDATTTAVIPTTPGMSRFIPMFVGALVVISAVMAFLLFRQKQPAVAMSTSGSGGMATILPTAQAMTIGEGLSTKLQLSVDNQKFAHVFVFGEQTDMGRSDECGFNFPHGPRQISGSHARVRFMPTQKTFCIEDLGSRNGTYVNDRKVTGDEVDLDPGCCVRLAQSLNLDFRVHDCEGKAIAEFRRIIEDCDCEGSFLVTGDQIPLRLVCSADPSKAGELVIRKGMDDQFRVVNLSGEKTGSEPLSDGDQIDFGDRKVTVELS